jgi:hypothetical protein
VEHEQHHPEAGERGPHDHLVRVADREREQDRQPDRDRGVGDPHSEQAAHEPVARRPLEHRVLAQPDAGQAEVADARDDRGQREHRHEPARVDDPQVAHHQRGSRDAQDAAPDVPRDPQGAAADHPRTRLGRIEDVSGGVGHRAPAARSSA